MKKIISIIFIVLVLSGCSSDVSKSGKTVVTSFYPVYAITLAISEGAENINVMNLAQTTVGCLHDYELTAGDMKTISGADMFIINGGGMESFLNKAIEQNSNMDIVDASQGIELIHEYDGEYEQDEHQDHEGHEHLVNSHYWLLPENAIIEAENIKNALIKISPEYKELFESNYDKFKQSLKIEHTDRYNNTNVIIFHEGFEYLALNYPINIQLLISADENQTPSPKTLAEAVDIINEKNVRLLICADDAGYVFAETLAAETNAEILIIDAITSGNGNFIEASNSNTYKIMEVLK